jgi:hypothetical protein
MCGSGLLDYRADCSANDTKTQSLVSRVQASTLEAVRNVHNELLIPFRDDNFQPPCRDGTTRLYPVEGTPTLCQIGPRVTSSSYTLAPLVPISHAAGASDFVVTIGADSVEIVKACIQNSVAFFGQFLLDILDRSSEGFPGVVLGSHIGPPPPAMAD